MGILELLILILVLMWLTGNFFFASIGSILHLLLVIALVVLIYDLLVARRR